MEEILEGGNSSSRVYVLEKGPRVEIGLDDDGDYSIDIHYNDEEVMRDIRNSIRRWADPEVDDSSIHRVNDGIVYTTPAERVMGEEYKTVEPVIGIEDRLRERFTDGEETEEEARVRREDPDDDLFSSQKKPKVETFDGKEYYSEATFDITDIDGDEEFNVRLHITQQKIRARDAKIRFIVEPSDEGSKMLAEEVYGMIHSKYEDLSEDDEDDIDELVEETDVSFDDIGGLEEVKQTFLKDFVIPMKNPEACKAAGLEMSNGAILYGPQGTGKTMLAKALAEEAGGNYYTIDDSVLDKYVGETEENLREIVEAAQENGPSIIYIDEIDSLTAKREDTDTQHEQSKTGALLRLMDGFDTKDGVAFIAATNNPENVDDALMRPGRLDKKIEVPMPDEESRRDILEKKVEGHNAEFEDIDYDRLVAESDGASGADLENWVREAARKAAFPEDVDVDTVPEPTPVERDHFQQALEELGFTGSSEYEVPFYIH